MSLVQDFLRQHLPSQKVSPGGWISFNCPVCTLNGQPRPDTKRRGGVKYSDSDSFQYNCFNCHFTTGWSPGKNLSSRIKQLFKGLGASEADIQRLQLELMRETETRAYLDQTTKNAVREIFTPNWNDISLPAGSVPLSSVDNEYTQAGIAYLQHRGIFDYTEWYWCDSDTYHLYNRIILPLTYKNNTVGFHARWIGNPPDKKTAKVIKEQQKEYVYGIDQQNDLRKYVLVMEGEYDAVSISGVSTGSNRISRSQADIIESLNRQIIAVPDRDRAGRDFAEDAIEYGWSISIPEWNEGIKDVSEAVERYGRLFVLKTILDSQESNPIKCKVIARTHCE
jgi:hypothetical protein